MELFRYPRPSLKTILAITRAKKEIKKDLGLTALPKPFHWWPSQRRRLKWKMGYQLDAGRVIRDGLPKAAGCLVAVVALSYGQQQ